MPHLFLNGTAFHSAPKNGGTTIRMWTKLYEGGLPTNFEAELNNQKYYNLTPFGFPKLWRPDVIKGDRFLAENNAELRWCIKRDPVERFISAYTDKVVLEKLWTPSVDECLHMLESGKMELLSERNNKVGLFSRHFLPQYKWFGEETSYYTHIFSLSEMESVRQFCTEYVFKIPLPWLHARNQSKSKIEKIMLTGLQERRLKKIYTKDYELGYF